MGVIRSMKPHFRRRLANMMLEVSKPSEISLLSVVIMLAQMWRNVSADKIRNFFKKSFHKVVQEDQCENSGVEDYHDFRDEMSILTAEEELGTEEPPADGTLDAFLDAFEAEKLVSKENEEIEDEIPAVELEFMMVSDMMKQLHLLQRSMMAKEIEEWDPLKMLCFAYRSTKWLVQPTLNGYWTLH